MRVTRDVIVIAGLEGSLGNLRKIILGLPPSFPASILVILQSPLETLELGRNLAADGVLPILRVHEGQKIRKGYVYLGSSYASLVARPWGELGLEPALANDLSHIGIGRCFNSVSNVWGNRVIGILLGKCSEGATNTLSIVKSSGGVAIIQNSSKLPLTDPPEVDVDRSSSSYQLPIEDIAALVLLLVNTSAPAIFERLSRQMRSRTIYGC
jgi:two-component system chemotaxis response regulator CheB